MSDMPEMFEEEFEEGFEEVAEVAAVAEGTATKPKRVKKEKAPKPVKVSKPVTIASIEPETMLFPPDEFGVTLSSVSGRAYQFGDPAPLLMWVTRRKYNGEAVSEGVDVLHGLLGQIRFLTTLDRRLQDLADHNSTEADFGRANTWNAYKRLSDRVQEALVNVAEMPATSDHITAVKALKSYIDSNIATPAEETKELVTPERIATAEDGSTSVVPAEYKVTVGSAVRRTIADAITSKVAEIRSRVILLQDYVVADPVADPV